MGRGRWGWSWGRAGVGLRGTGGQKMEAAAGGSDISEQRNGVLAWFRPGYVLKAHQPRDPPTRLVLVVWKCQEHSPTKLCTHTLPTRPHHTLAPLQPVCRALAAGQFMCAAVYEGTQYNPLAAESDPGVHVYRLVRYTAHKSEWESERGPGMGGGARRDGEGRGAGSG